MRMVFVSSSSSSNVCLIISLPLKDFHVKRNQEMKIHKEGLAIEIDLITPINVITTNTAVLSLLRTA